MKSQRLICTDIRRIELAEFELPRVPGHGILVQNDYTAVSVGTEIYSLRTRRRTVEYEKFSALHRLLQHRRGARSRQRCARGYNPATALLAKATTPATRS